MPSYAIVGATRGIGLEYVRQLSGDVNNEVIAVIRNQNTAGPLNELATARKNIHVVESDTSEPSRLEATATEISKLMNGKLDVLVYNAVSPGTEAMVLAPSQFTGKENELEQEIIHSMQHNVISVMYTINTFLPLIRKGEEKKVIFITSGLADLHATRTCGIPMQIGYSVSKASANLVMAKYAVELASEGILTLSLSPGWVSTDAANEFAKDPAVFDYLLSAFKNLDPNVKGMTSVEESVKAQLKVIEALDPADSGDFISHHGNKEWL